MGPVTQVRALGRSMSIYFCLYPGANLFQQKVIRQYPKINWQESGRFFVYGGLFHGPLVHFWLQAAAKTFPGNAMRQVLKKVLVDQLIFAPIALTCFYVGLSALEFKSADYVVEEWREKFAKTWMVGACIWPFLQGINFRFVPPQHRPLYVGIMGFFWTTLLAYWKSEKLIHPV
eukprot:maker-scaffold101_size371023-snap-gene-0.25 protein:Tk03052 transcript:maker-scaffold101_size371023-snap-gene-0.25-mRNA-1 annotation:"PREDICTED: uncharacterized protein LOC100882334"